MPPDVASEEEERDFGPPRLPISTMSLMMKEMATALRAHREQVQRILWSALSRSLMILPPWMAQTVPQRGDIMDIPTMSMQEAVEVCTVC